MLSLENVSVQRADTLALKNVSLSLEAGRTLAVVGESGAGKSTLLSAILALVPLSSGSVNWSGRPVRDSYPSLVMQEPRSAFNPAISLHQSVQEPLLARDLKLSASRLERMCDGLELDSGILARRPAEVSIGQAQRVGILRALVSSPPLVLFDEPLSALDAVRQKHTAKLVADLQAEEGFAALIVTHDLGYACAFADTIAVLRAGLVEEVARPDEFLKSPESAYGQMLREAAIGLGALERVD